MKVDMNYRFRNLEGEIIKNQVTELDDKGNPIRDIQGFPLLRTKGSFTLKLACERSLIDPPVDQKSGRPEHVSGDEKLKRWELAKRIHDCNGLIDLKAEDITLLKNLIDKKYPSSPLIYGQACEILDPTEETRKK